MNSVYMFFLPFIAVLVIRLWNRPFKSSFRELLGISDFLLAISVGIVGLLINPFIQNLQIVFGFNSDVDGIILASITVLFTVLTYVTINTSNEVKKIAEANIKIFDSTHDELLKFRAYLQLLTALRQAEEETEFVHEKEIEVGHLRTIYKLFGSEDECLETLNLLGLKDKRDTLKYINQTLREYIFSLPRVYKHNPKIVTSVRHLMMHL